MKAKEAIRLIQSQASESEPWPLLVKLYRSEADERILRRSAGKKLTQNIVVGIADEMGQWIELVARGVDLEEEKIKLLVDSQRGDLLAKYRVMDPRAEKQMKDMRTAFLQGKHPGDVLTGEGLDAITGMMLGSITRDVREYYQHKGEPCLHGIEARFCMYQETYSGSRGVLPKSTEDLYFVCTIKPENCSWKKA